MKEIYGNIVRRKYHSYYKYVFAVRVWTDKGYELIIDTCGDDDSIYRFSPESADWDDVIDSLRSSAARARKTLKSRYPHLFSIISTASAMNMVDYEMSEQEMRQEKKANELADMYGKIVSVTIEWYYKYTFHLIVTTEKGYTVRVTVGGCSDEIYRFDPHDMTWVEAPYYSTFYYEVIATSDGDVPKDERVVLSVND